jgi:5-methylcytosine-specific restriction endonuclease McrA
MPSAVNSPYAVLYRSRAWRKTAAWVIARAGGRCEVCGVRRATSADHIVPAAELWESGRIDAFFDTMNLRASCRSCNSRGGAYVANSRRRGPRTAIY